MMYLSKAKLVAAVSNAGGLGVVASAIFPSVEAFKEELQKIKDLTDKPFAVNLNLFPSMRAIDNDIYLEVLVSEGVKIVETSGFSLPEDLVDKIKSANLLWMHKCAGVKYAIKAEKMGADAVTVVGFENGGAIGKFDIGTFVLIPAVRDAVKIPVVAGGGVADGRGLLAALALGADGVIIGTRLMLSQECDLHPNIKKLLCDASVTDTTIVMRSTGYAHRVIINEKVSQVLEVERKGGGLEQLLPLVSGKLTQEAFEKGDKDIGLIYCSQGVGMMKEVMPVKNILEDMVMEAESISKRLQLVFE